MIKAVIFDMDGLMFDTEALSSEAWKYVGEKFGYDITGDIIAKTRALDVNHIKEIFEKNFGEDIDFFNLYSVHNAYMNEYIDDNGIPIKNGLKELLDYVKKRGLKIAIATSTDNKRTVYYLTKANILKYFNNILCGDMVENGKPDPEIYLKAADSLGFKPEQCIVLEDSLNGSLAAYNAGCPVIMVPDLDKPGKKIKKIVDDLAKDLNDVIKKLEKM